MSQTIVAPLTRLSRLDLSRTLVFREILRMGIDSVLQIVLYVVGIVVLMGLPSAPQ